MAKKKSTSTASSKSNRAARMGSKNPKELRGYADRLQKQQGELLGLAQAMEKAKINEVWLDGVTKFDKGMEMCYEFIDAVEVAIRKAKRLQD